jgi:tetratricopeptide (TPR) repeat protein
MQIRWIETAAALALFSLGSASMGAQSFGTAKEKVLLQRKLPALAHLVGNTINVKTTAHKEFESLAPDLESLLETELLKNDPSLKTSANASTIINCQIIDYAHPQPIVTTQPALSLGKKSNQKQTSTRITGSLTVSFQARGAGGQTISSDTVSAMYDRTFDGSGDIPHAIKNTVTDGWKRITKSGSGEDSAPPTDAELRSRLITDVVNQIASHLVNTRETVEAYLAKDKGQLQQGDKDAAAGLWQRALETYETAPQLPRPDEDAYRLYNIGVAYEALAYKAEDQKSAIKFLDEAAINYGKAIDSKPSEKYFLEPQKRIETALAHYKKLANEGSRSARSDVPEKAGKHEQASANTAGDPTQSANAAGSKALTNDKVIAMVKAGVDDDTIAQAIRTAKLARFDLSNAGLQSLSTGGVSDQVLKAMKVRSTRKTVAAK